MNRRITFPDFGGPANITQDPASPVDGIRPVPVGLAACQRGHPPSCPAGEVWGDGRKLFEEAEVKPNGKSVPHAPGPPQAVRFRGERAL